jgi:hypothetical protein
MRKERRLFAGGAGIKRGVILIAPRWLTAGIWLGITSNHNAENRDELERLSLEKRQVAQRQN